MVQKVSTQPAATTSISRIGFSPRVASFSSPRVRTVRKPENWRGTARAAPAVTNGPPTTGAVPMADLLGDIYEQQYLTQRLSFINEYFPNSLLLDDFIHRLEIALFSFGFTGENSIACVNLCRDEITGIMKSKLDHVFGHAFNVNGLGGVLTFGALGFKAGLSHSPVDAESGKERYVFFSFPHIGLSPYDEVGGVSRPGRPGPSKACGALCKALADLQSEGLKANCKTPGVHEPDDPEYSILKQRLARRLASTGSKETDTKNMDLVYLTKLAERVIFSDLENLIQKTVDTDNADYAVVTGVQIHSWGKEYDDGTPHLEYIYPCAVYTVVDGQKTPLNLSSVPALTPRQIRELSIARGEHAAVYGQGPVKTQTALPVPGKRRSSYFRDLLEHLKTAGNTS